jgi:hypothetical protein
MTEIRSLSFGDLDAGVWGVAWGPAEAELIPVALGTAAEAQVLSAKLTADGDAWRLVGDGLELALSPLAPAGEGGSAGDGDGEAAGAGDGEAAGTGDGEAAGAGFDQLCTVSGRLPLGGERELAGLGWRSARQTTLEAGRIDSFRQVSAWFGPDDGLTLTAIRPRKARGQETDLVAASLVDPEQAPLIAESRLSTTYDRAGLPARAGVELWLEQPATADGTQDAADEDSPASFSRRAAGEALSPGAAWEEAGLELHAAPFRWHSRGHHGAGVYLLGRRPG